MRHGEGSQRQVAADHLDPAGARFTIVPQKVPAPSSSFWRRFWWRGLIGLVVGGVLGALLAALLLHAAYQVGAAPGGAGVPFSRSGMAAVAIGLHYLIIAAFGALAGGTVGLGLSVLWARQVGARERSGLTLR